MLKFGCSIIWRLGSRGPLRKFSTPSATVFKTNKTETSRIAEEPAKVQDESGISKNSGLVAAAFASINSPDPPEGQKKPSPKSMKISKTQQVEAQILRAKDVESLLVVAENSIVSRRHALKMVSILSEWSSSNKVNLSDFEKDPRFLKLCRILARTSSQSLFNLNIADDLGTVLGITGDDEAARLITNLTLPQMVKVLRALNQKNRRSTPLLRALAHNIVKQAEPIDLKKSADILFSVAALSFPDPVLLDRICSDVITLLPTNADKPAVVTSIITSLGLLRYRHEPCIAALVDWMTEHKDLCRPSDLVSAVVTLATVDFAPSNADELIEMVKSFKEDDLAKPSAWLDLVYSLLVLNKATERHLTSTLKTDFIEKLLASGEISIPARRKLLSIDGYVSLAFKNYKGPRLQEDITVGLPIVYAKDKCQYVQSVMDTFRNMISSDSFMKKNCNSEMGFLYDGEFALDSNCNPVPLEKAANNKNVFRIAVQSLDYHDLCRRTAEPLGAARLYQRILTLQGYHVLQVPYTEFNPKDKLLDRVKYIDRKMKQIVNGKSSA